MPYYKRVGLGRCPLTGRFLPLRELGDDEEIAAEVAACAGLTFDPEDESSENETYDDDILGVDDIEGMADANSIDLDFVGPSTDYKGDWLAVGYTPEGEEMIFANHLG